MTGLRAEGSGLTESSKMTAVLVDDEELRVARLALVRATKTVLALTLGLAGVSAPESMERI